MAANAVVALLATLLSIAFAVLVFAQWLARRRTFQLAWAAGVVCYALATGTEFLGSVFGWNSALYRLWYVSGAVLVAALLGAGTLYLLRRTGFGYLAAFAVLLGGLTSLLSTAKYAGSGPSGIAAFIGSLVAAAALVMTTARYREATGHVFASILVIAGVMVAAVAFTAHLSGVGYALDPNTHVPLASGMPGGVRVLTFPFNAGGGFCLVFGAVFSIYLYMPKRRVLRRGVSTPVLAQAFTIVVVVVNLVASLPAAFAAAARNRLNSRVPATVLIAIGASVTGITSGLERFGITWSAYFWQLVGIALIFVGFLVSEEVFAFRANRSTQGTGQLVSG